MMAAMLILVLTGLLRGVRTHRALMLEVGPRDLAGHGLQVPGPPTDAALADLVLSQISVGGFLPRYAAPQ